MHFHQWKRREFITLLGGAAAAWPLAARAQQPTLPTIGFMSSLSRNDLGLVIPGFHEGLNAAGFVEGRNLAIEYRWAEGDYRRLGALAADLVNRKVAVIAAISGTPSALAAKAATTAIPIVFAIGGDPVAPGLVASLNRPGGNVTGASAAAARLGWHIEVVAAANSHEIDDAFATLAQERIDALLVGPDSLVTTRRVQLAVLAAHHRLPTIYPWRDPVEVGGLVSYGANVRDLSRQTGIYVGRVLKGDKPADLPVVQSTKFELIVNLQTAKALGITIPPTLLARADEVIE